MPKHRKKGMSNEKDAYFQEALASALAGRDCETAYDCFFAQEPTGCDAEKSWLRCARAVCPLEPYEAKGTCQIKLPHASKEDRLSDQSKCTEFAATFGSDADKDKLWLRYSAYPGDTQPRTCIGAGHLQKLDSCSQDTDCSKGQTCQAGLLPCSGPGGTSPWKCCY